MTHPTRAAAMFRRLMAIAPAAVACLVLIAAATGQRRVAAPKPVATEQGVSVFFSPDGGCMDAVQHSIARARRTIDVQAFILSTSLVSRPLIAASQRGVRVRIIMDAGQADADFALDEKLADAGIEVYRCKMPDGGSMHHKTMVIDGSTVLTGSFNFSRSAQEKNAENLLVLTGKPKLAAAFAADFDDRLAVSERVE